MKRNYLLFVNPVLYKKIVLKYPLLACQCQTHLIGSIVIVSVDYGSWKLGRVSQIPYLLTLTKVAWHLPFPCAKNSSFIPRAYIKYEDLQKTTITCFFQIFPRLLRQGSNGRRIVYDASALGSSAAAALPKKARENLKKTSICSFLKIFVSYVCSR